MELFQVAPIDPLTYKYYSHFLSLSNSNSNSKQSNSNCMRGLCSVCVLFLCILVRMCDTYNFKFIPIRRSFPEVLFAGWPFYIHLGV